MGTLNFSLDEPVRNTTVAVGTSNVLISQARRRKEIIITNTSTSSQNITISVGADAVAGAGIFLLPFSVYYFNSNGEVLTTALPIYAISSASSGQVGIFER